jgi:hypothetical protein
MPGSTGSADGRGNLRPRPRVIGTLGSMIRGGSTAAGPRRRIDGFRRPVAAAVAAIPVVLLVSTCSSSADRAGGAADDASRAALVSGAHRSGSLVQADALGNTVVGGGDRTALAFRFRARWTGSVAAVRFYVIMNVNGRTGYSSGDGGTMRVTLRADSGRRPHVPVGRELARATFRPASGGTFPLVRFSRPAPTAAGRFYHVVFQNVGRDPARNYVSINGLWSSARLGRGPAVPGGMAVLEKDRGEGWQPRRSEPHEYYLPILEVAGGRDGQRTGLGYMEVWDPKPIGGAAGVRQLLHTPAGRTTQVGGAWLRVRRDEGASAPLVLRLDGPDGRPLASATVSARDVPTSDAGWVHARFPSPATLPAGADVALSASSAQDGAYEAFPIRKGTDYGFDSATYFNGGYAQFNTGSGWVGWDQWGGHDEHDSDLQFALDLAG